ncbi:MAG: hypothetical protein JOZ27_02500 [Caulobacteraceae bacterium]|nr:hypothetical protein [Caulobacteraceae bacterium]
MPTPLEIRYAAAALFDAAQVAAREVDPTGRELTGAVLLGEAFGAAIAHGLGGADEPMRKVRALEAARVGLAASVERHLSAHRLSTLESAHAAKGH